ncbi:MAG: hypothetical protein GY851_33400 [bacterium]|nr:hypothetical protein [bacterium]
MADNWTVTTHDLDVLRALAERKRACADDPANAERRRLWYAHDAGHGERPMVLAEGWVAFEDLPESAVQCHEPWAQDLERQMRLELYNFDTLRDDHVIEPVVNVNWRVDVSGYGVESKTEYADRVSGNVSSRRWDPPLQSFPADLDKLRHRAYSVDRDSTFAWKAHLEHVFDGVLDVRIRGGFWWTTGMTITAIDLIGLQNMMLYMCTEPEGLHALMAFLRDDQLAYMDWLEAENLLTPNNENDYIGSGSIGYTRALPKGAAGDPVRAADLWVLSESQETSEVGPDMFDEFVFQYQLPIIERFGACYYGCCEAVHLKWPIIQRAGNVRRVSISPWCDQEYMAEVLGRDVAFSRKPNPTLISTPHFDEDLIRADLRETVGIARDCNLELIMKDVHTLCGNPDRMPRWVQLAREAIDEAC